MIIYFLAHTQWAKKPSHLPRSADKQTKPCMGKSSGGSKTTLCGGADVLHDARRMNAKELKDTEALFSQAAEVAATLVFSDGSTQLREVQVGLLYSCVCVCVCCVCVCCVCVCVCCVCVPCAVSVLREMERN